MPAKTLKQIYDESVSCAKQTTPKLIQRGELHKWKGCLNSFIIGELKFSGIPYFCLNISDESHTLPCILLDPVKNLKKLLKFYGHVVLVNEPELIVEIFIINNAEYPLVHLLLDAEKVHIVEKNIQLFSIALKESKNNSSHQNSKDIGYERKQKFIPLKVSAALLTSRSELFCFILALFIDSDLDCHRPIWLILRNWQIVWKDLLLPYHVYYVVLPQNISRDYFKSYNSLISIVDENLDVTFHQILHHKEFSKTNAAIFLPEQSKIIASLCNSAVGKLFERWYSISDPQLKFLKFTCIFGIIKEIKYFDSFKTKNCLWCYCGNTLFEATLKEPPSPTQNFENKCSYEWHYQMLPEDQEDEELLLPNAIFDVPRGEKIVGFGVRGGKLCIQITLQSCSSEDVASIFIKRWQLQQYPAGLVKGVTVLFTDVSVKRSKIHKYYFICTPFTRILHLNSGVNESLIVTPIEFFKFGFPFTQRETGKIWGILELDLLVKASISTKCKTCRHSFVHYSCSNTFCSKYRVSVGAEYDTVASARLFVHNFKGSEMSTLYLKNELVQKYLGIPSRIWRHLCKLSANTEFLYLHRREEKDNSNQDAIATFFHFYCKYFRPKNRYHVLCKQFKDDLSRFFCLELADITEERLAVTHSSFERLIEEKEKMNRDSN